MGESERGGTRVKHHGDVTGRVLEQPGHLLPKRLERLEHGSGLGALRRVVAGRERRRMRLLPGHARTIEGSDPFRRVDGVATWDDVRRLALALPETSEGLSRGLRQWRVKDKGFVWERPLRRSDLEALGDEAPEGPILGARVEHLVAKEALLADDPTVYFTTPHFDGYPAILVRLDRIGLEDLQELTVEAWLARAPARLAKTYLDTLR